MKLTGMTLAKMKLIRTQMNKIKLLRRAWLLFFFTATAMTIPLMWLHNFIPSIAVQSQAHWFALLMAILMTLGFIVLARNPEPGNADAPTSVAMQIGQGVFCGLLMYGASWVNYSLLPGQIFNRLAGEQRVIQLSGEADKVSSRHSCDYRIRLDSSDSNNNDLNNSDANNNGLNGDEPWQDFWLSHWCISYQQYQQYQQSGAGKKPFAVTVQQSYWGRLLLAVEHNPVL